MDDLKETFLYLYEVWEESNFLGKSALVGAFVGISCLFLLIVGIIISCFIVSPILGIVLGIGFWTILSVVYLLATW